jgi:diketogulonate reductase-like aldo/keto reductase
VRENAGVLGWSLRADEIASLDRLAEPDPGVPPASYSPAADVAPQ